MNTAPDRTVIEGRRAIADALAAILGVPLSVRQLDRLQQRPDGPPVHTLGGVGARCWAFEDELREWWTRADKAGKPGNSRQTA